jgi:hypothetical protein
MLPPNNCYCHFIEHVQGERHGERGLTHLGLEAAAAGHLRHHCKPGFRIWGRERAVCRRVPRAPPSWPWQGPCAASKAVAISC